MKNLVPGIGTVIAGLTIFSAAANAQAACHGTPRGMTVAYEYGKLTGGNSQGVAVTLPSLRLGARMRDLGDNYTGNEFDLRVSVPIGPSTLKICPLIGATYGKDEWNFDATSTMTSQTLALRAGGAIGGEFPVAAGFSAIPFVQVAYQFRAVKFDVEATSGNIETSADTVSGVDIEYGLVGRYRNFFAGFAANRSDDTKGIHPYQSRLIFGFSFSGGSRSSRDVIPAVRDRPRKR